VPPPIKGKLSETPAPADALGKAQAQKDQIETEATALEEEIEELKVKYEMYFLGVEKREPNRQREDLKKRVLRLKEAFTRNAALRFRLQSIHARFLSYERMWMRSAREKEDGTYHRDVFKAKMRTEVRAKKEAERLAKDPFAALAAAQPAPAQPAAVAAKPGAPGAKPAAPAVKAPAGAARPAAPPPTASGGGMGDRQMKELYTQYIAAKKQCGEDVSRLTYDAVAKSVTKQVPEIMTKFNAKSVEFKVVVKDGKATLKAVPKS
jgi:FtsZ-binding cell division protein ZapB